MGRCLQEILRYSQVDYSIRCMFPKWGDWEIQYTRKGIIREKVKRALKVLAFAAFVVAAFKIRKHPITGLMALPNVLKRIFKQSLMMALGTLDRAMSWLAE